MRRREQILVHGQGRSGAWEPGPTRPADPSCARLIFRHSPSNRDAPVSAGTGTVALAFPDGAWRPHTPRVAPTISPGLAKAAVTVRRDGAQADAARELYPDVQITDGTAIKDGCALRRR